MADARDVRNMILPWVGDPACCQPKNLFPKGEILGRQSMGLRGWRGGNTIDWVSNQWLPFIIEWPNQRYISYLLWVYTVALPYYVVLVKALDYSSTIRLDLLLAPVPELLGDTSAALFRGFCGLLHVFPD